MDTLAQQTARPIRLSRDSRTPTPAGRPIASSGSSSLSRCNRACKLERPFRLAASERISSATRSSRSSSVTVECVFTPDRRTSDPFRSDDHDLDALELSFAPSLAPAPVEVNKPGLNGLEASNLEGLLTGEFRVTARQPIDYMVKEVSGLLDPSNPALLADIVPDSFPYRLMRHRKGTALKRRVVIMDQNIESIYGDRVRSYMDSFGVECKIITLDAGEAHKNFDQVFRVAEEIEEWGVNRRKEPIIAIGGGVLLDIAALASNLFRRSTPIIKVPTTLMAVVDASIGVKTGVNFHHHKNKLGTYCAPLATFYDLEFLKSLDARNVSNGIAEIIKMACIKDPTLFSLLEQHGAKLAEDRFQDQEGSPEVGSTVIRRSIQGMLEELEPNLFEHILVRVVDYGHTISTRVEMDALECDDPMLHGEAVAVDMAVTTVMARNRGLLTESECTRTLDMIRDVGLDLWHPSCTPEASWKAVEDMSRARDGFQRLPLMDGIGAAVFVNNVTYAEVEKAVHFVKQEHLRMHA